MRTSFDMPTSLRIAMEQAREEDGYSTRCKSRWICEALVRLIEFDPTLTTVGLSDGLKQHNVRMPIHLTMDAADAIQNAKVRIRRLDPAAEGLTGQIIRAAIRQRLQHRQRFSRISATRRT